MVDTQGIAPAMYEELIYDDEGIMLNGHFYGLPGTYCNRILAGKPGMLWHCHPHHPIGAKGCW